MIVRKLSVFEDFAGSLIRSIFAAIMTKELKIETRGGTLLDGVLFGTGDKADTVKSSGIAASRGSDTVLICIQLRENFGHSETLYACNTYQFTDYLQNAFELGKRLVNNCQKQE